MQTAVEYIKDTKSNEEISNDNLQISDTRYERFGKDSQAPGDWSTSVRFEATFLRSHQETYDGRAAVDMDPDFDEVTTPAENACGMNPNNRDTDGDGITDTLEYNACANFDGTGGPDANDTDADGDGILDNQEDKNFNGKLDAGETDRLGTDTDAYENPVGKTSAAPPGPKYFSKRRSIRSTSRS
jgi:hypothetical protein